MMWKGKMCVPMKRNVRLCERHMGKLSHLGRRIPKIIGRMCIKFLGKAIWDYRKWGLQVPNKMLEETHNRGL